jgi:Homeobox KN domain
MHSSHINHYNHSDHHPHHQDQQRSNSASVSRAVGESSYETIQQRMKPPHPSSMSTSHTPSLQPKYTHNDTVVKSTTLMSSSQTHGNSSMNSPNVLTSHDTATMDDFDIMLLHEDFPHLLMMAAKVKSTHRAIASILNPTDQSGMMNNFTTTALFSSPTTSQAKNALFPDEILRAVERMQQVLIHKKPSDSSVIPRGLYPITDSLMEDAMIVLHQEYENGRMWIMQHQEIPSTVSSSSSARSVDSDSYSNSKRHGNDYNMSSDSSSNTTTGGPITIKYAKWQTDALMNWMIENKDQPFPDTDAIEFLVNQTGLTNSQIVNWTTNVRKRNRKATCENGKKPHHFLDFLFLVHDRETKKANAAAATSGGIGVDTGANHYDYPVRYGESPRMSSSISTFGAPAAYKVSPSTSYSVNSGRPLEQESSVPQSHHDRYGQNDLTESNRIAIGINPSVNKNCSAQNQVLEPMPIMAPPNDDVMVDFADCWLNDNRNDMELHQNLHVQYHIAANGFVPAPLDQHINNILPSVTDDSHDNAHMDRTDSPAFSLGSLIGDDDMLLDEWISYGRGTF